MPRARRQRAATWPITDAGGDIVGLCDMNGPIPPGGNAATARVVGEWVYDAYGEPIFASNPHPHAVLKCGHKGLFFDRLDAGVYDAATGGEMERLVPDARGLYYARNRHHKPDWGRWLQQDPNATGLPVQARLAFHGEMLGIGVDDLDLGSRHWDSSNLYAYLGENPPVCEDPSGLFFGVVGNLMMAGCDAYATAEDMAAMAAMAYSMIDSIDDFFSEHLVSQMMDVDWATDWSLSDYEYNASGWMTGDSGDIGGDLGQDVALAAGAPPHLRWNGYSGSPERFHGGSWHDRRVRAWAEFYSKKYGEQNVRFNQGLVDPRRGGRLASSMRPDVQAYDAKHGRWYIREVTDSHRLTPQQERARTRAMADALGVDPKRLNYKTFDRRGTKPGLPHAGMPGSVRRRR